MRQKSLRVWLPLLLVVVLFAVGMASLTYTVHQRQQQLTEEARGSLFEDVTHLARLVDQGWPNAVPWIAADVAELASRPRVQAVMLLTDGGEILMAKPAEWRGRPLSEVWPQLHVERLAQASSSRKTDWQLSDDGHHMDALLAVDLPPPQDGVHRAPPHFVYVAYDLSQSRAQASHAEIVSRVPDMVGLLALFVAMIWLLGRYVTGPLARLDHAAMALRAGQWDVDIPKGGFQEIDRLGGGFEALRQELAATWRAMPDLLFELDADGRYVRVVASRPDLLVSDPEKLVGRTVGDVMPPLAAQTVLQALAEAAQSGGVWGREVELDVAMGRRWFEISVARKMAPHGGAASFLLVSRDITERKFAEDRLRHLNDELEQRVAHRTAELLMAKNEAERANQSKSDFLSRMSHELRTPLNAILGFGQLLELSVRDAAQQAHVRQILHGGKHLLALINEVLDLARVESGQMSVSLEAVSLTDLVHECQALVRPQAQALGVYLLEGVCDEDVQVMADRIRLKQVLLNLLSNAIKYNHSGGEVSVSCIQDEGMVGLHVRDTGSGLTAEQLSRLFVPFERLGADERHIEGTGIGLALSKRLVDLMGGQIGADSQSGVGSTFWVKLSRTLDGEGMPGRAHLSPVPVSHDVPAEQGKRTVLCIEDNPNNLQLIDSVLGMLPDVRLISAIAPGLGLELARTHRPDLILLDINLPDMDGYAVMLCLRAHAATQHIPVVAVSANAMPQDLERGRAAGFSDYITKPIDVVRLLRVVDQLAGTRRSA